MNDDAEELENALRDIQARAVQSGYLGLSKRLEDVIEVLREEAIELENSEMPFASG